MLDEEDDVVPDAEVPQLDDDELLAMYREMRLARRFDTRAMRLQRERRIGTDPPLEGRRPPRWGVPTPSGRRTEAGDRPSRRPEANS